MRKEWQLHALGDVCKMGSGGTPLTSKREYYNGGTIPWLQSGEVAQGEVRTANNFITQAGFENSATRIFPRDTVLVAMYGATAGQVGILRFEASTNQAICGILPNERFHPKFLYYALLSKKKELISRAVGNAQPNISQVKIKNTYVPVPPLVEQKRIVAILDEAFEDIDAAFGNAEKNLGSARELFESYLNSVFTKRVESWSNKSLEEVGRLQTGTTPKTSEKDNLGTYIPFIKPGDFREDGSLDYENQGLSKLGLTQSRLIRSGSAVMVCIGATIGKAGFAERDISANQQINAVTPGEGIAGKFLYYQMISDRFQKQVMANSAQATLPIINKTKWGGLVMLLPPTRREQEQLVSRLDQLSSEVQRLEETYRQKLASLAELKEAILQKAFAGELTAQPDKALPQAAE